VIGGEGEASVLRDLEDGLNEALAKGGFADDQGAVVILEGAGDDFSGRGSVAVDQNDDGELGAFFAAGCAIDLVREGAPALGDYDLPLLQEFVGHVDGFV